MAKVYSDSLSGDIVSTSGSKELVKMRYFQSTRLYSSDEETIPSKYFNYGDENATKTVTFENRLIHP